jgi:ATP/maltotriose-dependent transcriptional regulator MalT
VGVRLAALALRDGGEAAELERGFSGSTPQVQQYFIEEVLSQQSDGARDWLLRPRSSTASVRPCAMRCSGRAGEG